MDYRQLRYFIAVAEELSFSRAARRLNISQPPLSIQIKAIEAEVGTALFSRNRRKVELTPAGEVLLENARRAVRQLEHTTEAVRRAGRGEAGTIRLAGSNKLQVVNWRVSAAYESKKSASFWEIRRDTIPIAAIL